MYKPIWFRIVVLLCLLFAVSCGSRPSKAGTPVTDEELNAAIEQARGTMDTLLRGMIAPKPSYDFLGVKVRFFSRDRGSDDNWVEPVAYYNGIFTIRMMDGLTYDTNLHIDHTLDISEKKVVDWMIVEKDGTLIGGYTIRLAYEHMNPDEKKEFLRVTGYKIKSN
jgi:uncharacterized protein YegJ (DUF2314 family)